MTGKLRIGVAGAGAIRHFHLVGWSVMPDARVVAVYDFDEARAPAKAQAFKIFPGGRADFRAMIEREKLDAVDIVTPFTSHAPLTRLAGEDSAGILLQGAGGITAVPDGNISAPDYGPMPTDRFEIMGTRGILLFDDDRLSLVGSDASPVTFDLAANYQACFSQAVQDFVEGIRDHRPFATDRLDNLETLRLMEACHRAAGVPIA